MKQSAFHHLFSDYLVEWLRNRTDIIDNTKRLYRVIIEKHIIPATPSIPLANINAMTVESILKTILDKGLSGSYNRNVFKVLHKSLKDAAAKGLIPRNPAGKVAKPKLSQRAMAQWNPDEATRFLSLISEHRLSIIFILALHVGMRQSEILGLSMSDIDLDNKSIHIRNILNYKKELQTGTKSISGTRSISLGSDVVDAIKKRINLITQEKQAAGDKYNDLGFLVFVLKVINLCLNIIAMTFGVDY